MNDVINETVDITGICYDITEVEDISLTKKYITLQQENNKLLTILAAISHDLKSPFNSIIGFAQLLARDSKYLDEEKVKKYSQYILTSAQDAYSMTLNILKWAKSKQGFSRNETQVINAGQLIEETIGLFKTTAERKNVTLINQLQNELTLRTEMEALKTILRNLVSNAIKFSYPDGEIYVGAKQIDDKILFEIIDQGKGIEPEKLKGLFEAGLKESEPGTADEKGTGMGLYICQELAAMVHGKIWAKSEREKGCVFCVELPVDYCAK
jgi:signal transduction histidine kinase